MSDATSSETRLSFFERERDRYRRLKEEMAALLRDLQKRRGLVSAEVPAEVRETGDK
ncbi:MAG: hypothetical protein PHR36_00240 [Patescibacteria group bacterium]|nr:hypothetical protein [Patescibacteria group bacterium]